MAYERDMKVTKDGLEAIIKDSSWKLYERLGWTRADDGSSESSTEEPAGEPEPDPPAKKTAAKKATTRKAD